VSFTSSNTSFATVNGTTVAGVAAGNVTITASQPGNDNFTAAESVTRTLTVSTGATFESLFGNQTATSDVDNDGVPALVEYAIGGNSTANDASRLPQMSRNGTSVVLTAIVRINDPAMSFSAHGTTNLAGSWTTGIQGTEGDQTGVQQGFSRRVFSFDAANSSRAFMRLHIQRAP
jgi:hypothetical protein